MAEAAAMVTICKVAAGKVVAYVGAVRYVAEFEAGKHCWRVIAPDGTEQFTYNGKLHMIPLLLTGSRTYRVGDGELEEEDQALIGELLADARAHGCTVADADLRRQITQTAQDMQELEAEFAASGQHPMELLRAIAAAGGFSLRAEGAYRRHGMTGLSGELRWLKDSFQVRGMVRGVRGVFQETGLSVDNMVLALRQDVRFQHIETPGDLLTATEAAARTPETAALDLEKLLARAGIRKGRAWWSS